VLGLFGHVFVIIIFNLILASIGFMSGFVENDKKMVCVYPIFLFYLVISWFVLDM